MPKEHEAKGDGQSIYPAASHQVGHIGETLEPRATTHDAVFGEITEGGPNYRNVRQWSLVMAAIIMLPLRKKNASEYTNRWLYRSDG